MSTCSLSGACFLVAVVAAASELAAPVPISPLVASTALVEIRCPTFSWGAVVDAKWYELAVYLTDGNGATGEPVAPVLWTRLPGSATSWTPTVGDCLAEGARYAWSVRALDSAQTPSEWSNPRLFRVDARPLEEELRNALQLLQRYLGELEAAGVVPAGSLPAGDAAPRSGSSGDPAASQATGATRPSPRVGISQAAVVGEPLLKVNGSNVITVATLPGPRRFYVTSALFATNQVLTACVTGFHMASFWEILDVSNLVYDFARPEAKTKNDSGQGPPTFWNGFVRTGYDSFYSGAGLASI